MLATVAADALSWTDLTVTAGTTPTYAVTAVDTSGNAGPASSVAVTVPGTSPDPATPPAPASAGDAQAPTAPASLSAVPATTRVTLAWGASTDDVAVTGYRVMRDGATIGIPSGTGWTDTARTPLTTYTYTVVAIDTAGRESATATLMVRTTADKAKPSTPGGFRRVARSGTSATFAWAAASDNVRVVRYLVFKVGRTAPVASTTATRIRIRTVAGASYYVRAVDGAGNRSNASVRARGR